MSNINFYWIVREAKAGTRKIFLNEAFSSAIGDFFTYCIDSWNGQLVINKLPTIMEINHSDVYSNVSNRNNLFNVTQL